jgi:hypothetical protein
MKSLDAPVIGTGEPVERRDPVDHPQHPAGALLALGSAPACAGGVTLTSILTCPKCSAQTEETMPENACQFFYECRSCGALLRPKEGDCCVFCSYGSVPCPPVQVEGKRCC